MSNFSVPKVKLYFLTVPYIFEKRDALKGRKFEQHNKTNSSETANNFKN